MDKHKKKTRFVDDGRVIAPMNVAGMPWYSPRKQIFPKTGDTSPTAQPGQDSPADAAQPGPGSFAVRTPHKFTRRENAAFMSGVLKASLLAALVYIAALAAFILFCTEIWFR